LALNQDLTLVFASSANASFASSSERFHFDELAGSCSNE
jgi:hypothetical protein